MTFLSRRLCGLALGVGSFLLLPAHAWSQSQAELEDQILNGNTSSSSSKSSSSTSDTPYDINVPELAEPEEEKVREKDLKAVEEAIKGPRQIPFEHILVVQRRYIQKAMRHEIIPLMIGIQPADSFRKQLQWGFGYAFHLNENFGIEVLHVAMLSNFSTGLNNTLRENAQLETDRIEPVLAIGSTLQWTPLSSKAAAKSAIEYFEGYFLGGGGITRFENQSAGLGMAGVGFRVYLTKYALLKAELRDYIDFRSGVDHRFNILAGASVLLGRGQ